MAWSLPGKEEEEDHWKVRTTHRWSATRDFDRREHVEESSAVIQARAAATTVMLRDAARQEVEATSEEVERATEEEERRVHCAAVRMSGAGRPNAGRTATMPSSNNAATKQPYGLRGDDVGGGEV
jgi:hypothetical protein